MNKLLVSLLSAVVMALPMASSAQPVTPDAPPAVSSPGNASAPDKAKHKAKKKKHKKKKSKKAKAQ